MTPISLWRRGTHAGPAGRDTPRHGHQIRAILWRATIRADDTALSMIREAGRSFVVQLLDWSQIELIPGVYFCE